MRLAELAAMLAEGARFELAVHEVDAGFQDRWFQPLTHPSEAKHFGRIVGTNFGAPAAIECLE
jgi:hypothetical protein